MPDRGACARAICTAVSPWAVPASVKVRYRVQGNFAPMARLAARLIPVMAARNSRSRAGSAYNANIADTDILRARAGGSVLGVNAGVVQNTPGGGTGGLSGTVGSGVGGTSVGSAGVGTGTNGLVSSTLGIGSAITSFDPVLTGTLQMDRDYALSRSALNGQAVTNTNTGTANLSYQQGIQ